MENASLENMSMELPMKCAPGLCDKCPLKKENRCIRALAEEVNRLRAERAKNPGVWDAAQKNADTCKIVYSRTLPPGDFVLTTGTMTYTRELPKSKAREIAERNVSDIWNAIHNGHNKEIADVLESAILEAQGNQS